MPNSPVTRGDVATLAIEVGRLQGEVHTLVTSVKTGLQERPTSDEIAATRRRFIAWALVILLISTCLTVVTLGTVVSQCFLRPPTNSTLYDVCSVIPGYDKAERDNKKNLDKFRQLTSQIPENERVNKQQQQEINRLKATLRKHHINP